MKYFKFIPLLILICQCSESRTDKFPLDKPYWGVEEYDKVIRDIDFDTPQDEKYPSYSDPELAVVIRKLVDLNNVDVVAKDEALGLRHRSEFTENMFQEYKELTNLYHVMDREDKFVYPQELVDIHRFGLNLQIHYFKIGNELLIKEADNPDQVKRVVRENENTIISNFNNYLDYINQEKSFDENSLNLFAEGINTYFLTLKKTFPDGNYSGMISKAEDMEKKALNPTVKKSLSQLLDILKPTDIHNDSTSIVLN